MKGRTIKTVTIAGLAGIFMMGCTSSTPHVSLPEARALGTGYAAVESVAPDSSREIQDMPCAPAGELTLEQALAAALLGNPDLEAYSHGVRAAEARILQARVPLNPELSMAVEEFDRDGSGLDSAEISIVLAQVFELGGKRKWRKRVAEAEGELAGWDYERQRLAVFAECATRFIETLAAQERLALATSAVELARKTSQAVRDRVTAGKEPPPQALKSEAELELVRLEASAASKGLAVARRKLAAMWGGDDALFETAAGGLENVPNEIPSLAELHSTLEKNPGLARWDTELGRRRVALSAERAARVPDLEASIGYLQFEEDGTDALAFGVAFPLPLSDRNAGSIKAAEHELKRAAAERSAAHVALASELVEAHAALEVAHERVGSLQSKVVPAMEQAYQAAHDGYRGGKYRLLDMLDAQRGLFEARSMLVDALYDYHVALVEIQRMTGTPLQELTNEGESNK